MARAALTVQEIDSDGLEASYTAANADGIYFVNDGRQVLHVKNGGVGAINVTVQTPNLIDEDLTISDRVVAVGAGDEMFIGTFPPADYNQGDRKVYVDFSGVTSVTVAALKV